MFTEVVIQTKGGDMDENRIRNQKQIKIHQS